MSPNARFAIFVAASAFFLLGPIGAGSRKRPWLPVRWRMYQGAGVNYCQAQVQAAREGTRYRFPQDMLVRAVGRGVVRTRHRAERFVLARRARENDVILTDEGELAAVVKALCEAEPDVRAEMRCSPPYPGGKWRAVEDGGTNLCQRTKWPLTSAPPPSGPQPSLDPETGEEIDPDAVDP